MRCRSTLHRRAERHLAAFICWQVSIDGSLHEQRRFVDHTCDVCAAASVAHEGAVTSLAATFFFETAPDVMSEETPAAELGPLERAGRLGDETKVWAEGMGQWQRLRQVRHMLPGVAADDSASD